MKRLVAVRKATGLMGLFRSTVPDGAEHVNVTIRVPGNNADKVSMRMILSEDAFMSMLYLERRRAERAQKRYVLLMVDVRDAILDKHKVRTLEKITRTLCSVTRETDIIGWYVYDHILGVIATEIGKATSSEVRERISQKFRAAFLEALGPNKASQISLSFHFFPEEHGEGGSTTPQRMLCIQKSQGRNPPASLRLDSRGP